VKSSVREHQPLPDLSQVKKKLQSANDLETQKTTLAIAKDEKKIIANPKKAREETPLGEGGVETSYPPGDKPLKRCSL
jgi:hypothetical protein